jgi:hypothetical protein
VGKISFGLQAFRVTNGLQEQIKFVNRGSTVLYEQIMHCIIVFHFFPKYLMNAKNRLKLGNACYHSVQNLLSSRLLYKNLKIKIYRTIILPVVLYGCETWSLTLREEQRLRVFEGSIWA